MSNLYYNFSISQQKKTIAFTLDIWLTGPVFSKLKLILYRAVIDSENTGPVVN